MKLDPKMIGNLLKSFGVELDPSMITKMGSAVEEIRERLERIETKLDDFIVHIEMLENKGLPQDSFSLPASIIGDEPCQTIANTKDKTELSAVSAESASDSPTNNGTRLPDSQTSS